MSGKWGPFASEEMSAPLGVNLSLPSEGTSHSPRSETLTPLGGNLSLAPKGDSP